MKINIKKPSLILDKEKVLRNIEKMVDKAKNSGVKFRPHFKTHQSAKIGEFFREQGVSSITVSSVDMAKYFSKHDWKDITIAFPVNLLQIDQINDLAKRTSLDLLVESKESIHFLSENLKFPVNAWIKIDVGYKRAGISANNVDLVVELGKEIEESDNLSFSGLLTHSGHSYHATSINKIKEIYQDTVFKLHKIRDALNENGFSSVQISIGDTPTCSVVEDFSDVDEIRPGNFVFYDVTQMLIGSCTEDDIAIAIACPVVAKHKERNEIVIYGGAVHLSKEFIVREDGTRTYGYIASKAEKGWGPMIKNSFVSSISQEHGIVKTDEQFFDKIKIGDILMVLPIHSCLAVNLLREYQTLEGESVKPLE